MVSIHIAAMTKATAAVAAAPMGNGEPHDHSGGLLGVVKYETASARSADNGMTISSGSQVSQPQYQRIAIGAPTVAAISQCRLYESLSTKGMVSLHTTA